MFFNSNYWVKQRRYKTISRYFRNVNRTVSPSDSSWKSLKPIETVKSDHFFYIFFLLRTRILKHTYNTNISNYHVIKLNKYMVTIAYPWKYIVMAYLLYYIITITYTIHILPKIFYPGVINMYQSFFIPTYQYTVECAYQRYPTNLFNHSFIQYINVLNLINCHAYPLFASWPRK